MSNGYSVKREDIRMRQFPLIALLFGLGFVGLVSAGEAVRRPIQSVPIEYVSPGSSGSVDSSSSSQRYDVYGGYRVPSDRSSTRSHSYGSSQVQQHGGIRQTIVYPNGHEVQRYPGQNSYEIQRNR